MPGACEFMNAISQTGTFASLQSRLITGPQQARPAVRAGPAAGNSARGRVGVGTGGGGGGVEGGMPAGMGSPAIPTSQL
jgi:hypothetical protein